MARERDTRLDVLKAAAILLVILGHVIRLVYVQATKAPLPLAAAFSVLALLDVPLFVFVSGYLAPVRAGAQWVGRRALQLLVPYVAWNVLRWFVFYRTDALDTIVRFMVWRNDTSAVWFLYALFLVCAIYAAVSRSRVATIALALACLLVPASIVPWFSLQYLLLLYPVFVAGRLAGERRIEPPWWILPATFALLVAMWSGAGQNLIFAVPSWASGLARAASWAPWPVAVLVNVLRMSLALALIGSAMYLARGARRGAWIGGLTLGMYASHAFFLPVWARSGGLADVVWAYIVVAAAAIGVTMVLQRWEWTSFLLLGSAVLPRPRSAAEGADEASSR
ncbi:MAG: acyltransferase family protein [Coriobacteriia bacterium]|nr:acyltransferase family protein [Coriobacteriia bacterium]